MDRDDRRDATVQIGSSDEMQRALRRYSSEFLLFVSPDSLITAGSQDVMLGYSLDSLGSHIAEFLHPDDLPEIFALIERARRTFDYHDRIRVRARHADGSWRLLEAAIFNAATDDELLGAGTVVRVRDVSDEAVWSETPPDQASTRFHSLAEALPQGILSADSSSWVVFCNEAATHIFNLTPEQLLGHGWERLVHPDDRQEVLDAMEAVLARGVSQQVMFRIQTGLFIRWATARFVPLGAPDQRAGWIATVDDVTDRRRAESELTHQATHDPLTGLPNRVLLEHRLEQACGRLGSDRGAVSVLFIDLDGFKVVNDTYGHTVGDQVLIEIANRLRQIVRSVDTVARLGGDEFVAFFESLPEDEVREVVERIQAAIAVPLVLGEATVSIGASIGVESTRDAAATFDELLARADHAMYLEKRLH
jgi:diguanylate cyclase (GGDEF)-like protein/PAS domain S-box-containing protein